MTTVSDNETQTLVILGASGDLTARLLLPGLGALLTSQALGDLQLIGSDLRDWDTQRWQAQVTESFAEVDATGPHVDAVVTNTTYLQADVTAEGELRALLAACQGPVTIYFALPPAITERACQALEAIGVPEGTRLMIEKPFGSDTDSAQALNELVTQIVPEHHVHRIDHFVAMPTVLNVLGLRFANRMFEPVLNNEHVASVDIVFDETLTLEGRADFYDATGALVDMIQSHMLEVLALFAMDPVPSLGADDVRDGKAQVLRATHIWDDDPVTYSRRARYTAGHIGDREVPSYVDEHGIDASSTTETLAELVLAVDTWRWSGVPFRVRSGKALGTPRTEIVITFQEPPLVPEGMAGAPQANRLHIGIDLASNELGLELNLTGPGDPFRIDPVSMSGQFGPGALPPYGEVFKSVLVDDTATLSVRGDMVVECWRIIEPVRQAWRNDQVPLQEYAAGSNGPTGWPETGLPNRAEQGE